MSGQSDNTIQLVMEPEPVIAEKEPRAGDPFQVPFIHSMQAKGFLFLFLLLAYLVFLAAFVMQQKNVPLQQFRHYQQLDEAESALVQADLAAFHIVTALFADVKPADIEAIVSYFSILREEYIKLQKMFPEHAESFRGLVESMPDAVANPTEDNLSLMHREIARAKNELSNLLQENRRQRESLIEEYRLQSNTLIINALFLGITGLVVVGIINTLFFTRLRTDLERLQKRVGETVIGYRGPGLENRRRDEVGALIDGFNHMIRTLRKQEEELEFERMKSSHHEKMAAVETLAGGIAHEIGNPITGISGLAREIKSTEAIALSTTGQQNLDLILRYSDGLERITQDIARFSQPTDDVEQLFDLNELIRRLGDLFCYGNRRDDVRVEFNLDTQLPAIHGNSDQISLLMTNLLENASVATQNLSDRRPEIRIVTSIDPGNNDYILITVEDNGVGMDASTLKQAFDPFFTTQPVGRGTGLGLPLCWSIVKGHKGDIELTSQPGRGSRAVVRLPVGTGNEFR